MRTLVIALLVAGPLALLTAAGSAHAGGYVSAGFGSDAALGGEVSAHFSTEDLTFQRLAVGRRMGSFALEAALFGTGMRGVSPFIQGQSSGSSEFSALSLGADVKYFLGLKGGLEALVHAGFDKTWLRPTSDTQSVLGYTGRGYTAGGGLQYSLRFLPVVEGAVWIDYSRHMIELEDSAAPSMSGSADMLSLGVTVGTSL
jgi:hypothetical protein